MSGVEVLAGAALAWLWRKLRSAGGWLDEGFDEVAESALDRLTGLVKKKLSGDPALLKLEQQAETGDEVASTQDRVRLSIQDAAEEDSAFAAQLWALLEQLQATVSPGQRVAGRDYYEVSGSNAQLTINNRD